MSHHFAQAFVLLGKLSILVILEMTLARLLDLIPLEVLAQLAFGIIEEVARLVRQAILFSAISIGSFYRCIVGLYSYEVVPY